MLPKQCFVVGVAVVVCLCVCVSVDVALSNIVFLLRVHYRAAPGETVQKDVHVVNRHTVDIGITVVCLQGGGRASPKGFERGLN